MRPLNHFIESFEALPRLPRRRLGLAGALTGTLLAALLVLGPKGLAAGSATSSVERGRYLVTIGGCGDCHTPGYLLGKPDLARRLGGSDVGFEIPGLGVFYGPNLTPDKATGLGTWSEADIVKAIQTGVRPDGRVLSPAMPWAGFAGFTKEDALSVAMYLKSLPPVANKVLGPYGADEKPTGFVMKVVPPTP